MRALWLMLVLSACGRFDFDLRSDGSNGDGTPPCTVGPWSAPQHLSMLATAVDDWAPALSDDGLTLAYDSGVTGMGDLYVSLRATVNDPFGAPIALTALDDPDKSEYGAAWLGQDLYYSVFDPIANTVNAFVAPYMGNGVFGASSPASSLPFGDAYAFSVTGVEGFFTISTTPGKFLVRHMTRPSTTGDWVDDSSLDGFAPGSTNAGWPSFDDGRQTLYFERSDGTNPPEVVQTTRPDVGGAFGSATHVETGGTDDGDPEISRDGFTLAFSSRRAGGAGQYDIYMMTRSCQ